MYSRYSEVLRSDTLNFNNCTEKGWFGLLFWFAIVFNQKKQVLVYAVKNNFDIWHLILLFISF